VRREAMSIMPLIEENLGPGADNSTLIPSAGNQGVGTFSAIFDRLAGPVGGRPPRLHAVISIRLRSRNQVAATQRTRRTRLAAAWRRYARKLAGYGMVRPMR
jgi:hypothetical protein